MDELLRLLVRFDLLWWLAKSGRDGKRVPATFLFHVKARARQNSDMPQPFDLDRVAKDLPAEARGKTRDFLADVAAQGRPLHRVKLMLMADNKAGRERISERSKARLRRRILRTMDGCPNLLHVTDDRLMAWVLSSHESGRRLRYTGEEFPDPGVMMSAFDFAAGPGDLIIVPIMVITPHAVARWFERGPIDGATTAGLRAELVAISRYLLIGGDPPEDARGNPLIISPTGRGAWTVDAATLVANDDVSDIIMISTYLPPSMLKPDMIAAMKAAGHD